MIAICNDVIFDTVMKEKEKYAAMIVQVRRVGISKRLKRSFPRLAIFIRKIYSMIVPGSDFTHRFSKHIFRRLLQKTLLSLHIYIYIYIYIKQEIMREK